MLIRHLKAARTLGANPFRVVIDVILPGLMPSLIASGAIAFATAMGAFGTAFTLATNIDVIPMVIYTEFTLSANIAMASALSIVLGVVTWILLLIAEAYPAQRLQQEVNLFKSKTKLLQLTVTLTACAFLLIPTLMSVLAGITVNYFKGVSSGLVLLNGY